MRDRSLFEPGGRLYNRFSRSGPRRKRKIKFSLPKWRRLRAELFKEADFTCRWCGWRPSHVPQDYDGRRTIYEEVNGQSRALEVDHIHPVALGGTNDRGNLQVLCSDCNRRKGSRGED